MAEQWDAAEFGLTPAAPPASVMAPANGIPTMRVTPGSSAQQWDPAEFGLTPATTSTQSAASTQSATPSADPFITGGADDHTVVQAGMGGALPEPPAAPPAYARRFGLGVRDVVEGVAGPAYDLAGAPLRAAGIPVRHLSENLDALGMPTARTPGERMSSAIIQPVAGSMTGQGIGRAMMGAASPVVRGVGQTLAAQPATQAVSAGVGGATTEATGEPLAGLAAGLAVPFAGAAAGRVVSPNILASTPERAALRATAAQENIPLTLAQQTGGKVARNFESTLGQMPGASGTQAAANAAQQEAWNAAVLRRAGIDATTATPDVLNAGRARLGAVFEDLSARNTLRADPEVTNEIQRLTAEVNRYAAPALRDPINARIEDVTNALAAGSMPGRAYQEMDSQLGAQIRATTDGHTREYLGRLRDALRGAMDRSISPEDQGAWRDVRRRYANLQTIARAMDRPSEGTVLGDISPAALAQASRNQPSKSFAFGRGDLDDLARLGQGALKQTIPDSGTAQRTMMSNLLQGKSFYPAVLGGGYMQNPLFMLAPAAEVGIPWAAAKAYHSRRLGNYLTNDAAAGVASEPSNALSTIIGGQREVDRLYHRR